MKKLLILLLGFFAGLSFTLAHANPKNNQEMPAVIEGRHSLTMIQTKLNIPDESAFTQSRYSLIVTQPKPNTSDEYAFAARYSLIAHANQNEEKNQKSSKISRLSNKDVDVWFATIYPKQPIKIDTRIHPQIIVAITDGKIKIIPQKGKSLSLDMQKGKAYWINKSNTKEIIYNETKIDGQPIELMLINVKPNPIIKDNVQVIKLEYK